MKAKITDKQITFKIIESISLDMREASFLRLMARFCIDYNMYGSKGAEQLDDLLKRMGVPEYNQYGVNGLFEDDGK